ncbi:MAG: glycosyltransferase family 4 protein [Leptolyngbyaceae cyanobacterium SU_3_3]|nr:glycosyltransferase family 4 protein [Leptolyngbyaceae cyanobacterium SU_3_3]NJR52412.1 glycosyltransferase family 4 protein [Leptolyngbyaceae cyanobacterium CSU_1_3]
MNMKGKICITTLEFPPDVGGVGESVSRIAKLLTSEGYEVHVAVFRSKQRLVPNGERRQASCKTTLQDGIYVHRIKSAAREAVPEIQDFFSEVYFYLRQLHDRHHFDLFHAFFLNETGYVTTLLAKEFNIPVINSVRGSDLHKHIFNPKTHGQIAWMLENSNWTTFVSRDLQRRAIALVPSIRYKSCAFWNSIVPFEFGHLPKPALLDQVSGVVIGSTGRFRDKKGIEYLLQSCAELSQEIDLTLLLVGDFVEKERTYWERQVRLSGIGNRLRITGIISREEALAYLPHLDIYAIPSLHDGCPNAMLEAMLAGCPVVGSNVDAIGEILADGTSGLVVEPANVADLTQALRYLALNSNRRQALGNGARQKVLTDLAPAVEKTNWMAVYQQVLSESTVAPDLAIA